MIGNEGDLVALRALGVVEQYQPVRVGHFAQGYLCSQPAATKVLARLEEAGYVHREASPNDKRASQLSLTDIGRARLAENRSMMAERMKPYFEALTPGDRLGVQRALGLVSQYLLDQHPVDAEEVQEGETRTD